MSTPTSTSAPVLSGAILADRDLDRRATSSLVWQGARVVVQTVSFVVLARLVAPAEFGKFALAVPLFALLGVFNDGGLSTAAVTGRRYDAALASMLCWTQMLLGAGVALAMAGLAPVLAALFGVPDLVMVGGWLAVSLFLGTCSLQSRAFLRREMRLGSLALVEVGGACAGLAGAWWASGFTTGVEVLLASFVFGAGGTAALAVVIAPIRLMRPRVTPEFRQAMRTGWDIVGAEVLNILRVHLPAFVAGFFVVLADVGLFNRANQLLNLPLAVIAPALSNFLVPLIARTRDDTEAFRRHVRRTQRLFLAVAVPFSVWIAAGPTDLIAAVLGVEWTPVVPILRNLSPLFISQVIATVAGATLVGTEQSRAVRWFSFWNLALTAVAVLLSAPAGVEAMALAIAASGIALRAPLLVGLAIRRGSLHAGDVWAGLRRLGLLAAAAAAVLWSLNQMPMPGLARDGVGLAACAALSAAAFVRDIWNTRRQATT